MASPKCPKCEKEITEARIQGIRAKEPGAKGRSVMSAAYLCPHCSVILGVVIDPVVFRDDLAQGVLDALREQ